MKRSVDGERKQPTAEEVSINYDFTGKVALITGATNGVGKEAARVMALRNCKVLLGARTMEKGIQAKKEILEKIGEDKAHLIEPIEINLSSLDHVRTFAQLFQKRADTRLHILMNNAGVKAMSRRHTVDGSEENFGVNHLAPFLLTLLMIPYLEDTAKITGISSRIVNVASNIHYRLQEVDYDDYNSEKIECDGNNFYAKSKLANILCSRELAERLEQSCPGRIVCNSVHPGIIITGLMEKDLGAEGVKQYFEKTRQTWTGPVELISIEEGAASQVFLAGDPDAEKVTGLYYSKCAPVKGSALAEDRNLQKKLWPLCEKLVGCTYEHVMNRQTNYPTAQDISKNYDLTGKVALITGASSGLGKESTRILVLKNCKVLLGARTIEKGLQAKKEILQEIGQDKEHLIEPIQIDLSTLAQVRQFATQFGQRNDKTIHILMNNAGVKALHRRKTPDGFEENIGINHLAPFLLTLSMLPYLHETAKKSGITGRIVNIASGIHYRVHEVDFDDYNSEKFEYDANKVYAIAKLATILYSRELNERMAQSFGGRKIVCNSLEPGIVITNFMINDLGTEGIQDYWRKYRENRPGMEIVSVPEAAATQVFLAGDPEADKAGGLYFVRCKPEKASPLGEDRQLQKKFWQISEKLVGLTYEEAIQSIH